MKHLFLFALITIFHFSCNGQKQTPSVPLGKNVEVVHKNIDLAAAKKMVAETKELTIIDVRTPEEIANGKIGNALEIDFKSADFKANIGKLDRSGQYLVYCHAGGRSAAAMEIMKEMGFKCIYNLEPGYRSWK